jgi:hypothetical protein
MMSFSTATQIRVGVMRFVLEGNAAEQQQQCRAGRATGGGGGGGGGGRRRMDWMDVNQQNMTSGHAEYRFYSKCFTHLDPK